MAGLKGMNKGIWSKPKLEDEDVESNTDYDAFADINGVEYNQSNLAKKLTDYAKYHCLLLADT